MASSRSRISTPLASLLAIAAAGGLCWWGARTAADLIERRSLQDVELALAASGQDWVGVHTDGLQVRLSGTAPTEVERFRAVTQAATAVDSSRIVDEMTVAAAEALTPPEFKVELLRNAEGISLIGLVPAQTDRAALLHLLRRETAAPKITDLLETADYDVPEGWTEALAYGLGAAQMVASAKISIRPGEVAVTAITDSRAEKGRLETALRRGQPPGIALSSRISAPRPVIAPFTLRFLIDDEGARFEACSADTEDGRDRILNAALKAGVAGKPGCTLGLGSPSPDWDGAAVPAIEAVARLGRASVTIADADIALTAPAGTDPELFDRVAGDLERALPPVFSLHAALEAGPDADRGPVEFSASLAGSGALTLRGRIADARMREAVDSYARARFAEVGGTLRSDAAVPGGWTVRVIGALEAMESLSSGTVAVTPDLVRLAGVSGDPDAVQHVAATLSNRIGPGARYDLSIRYDRRLDAALDLPDGEECVARLNRILSESEIGFEPSKSAIAGDPAPTLARMAEAMADCAEFQIEAGGHTDSQGSSGFNADLSRARAQALVAAMSAAGIDTVNMAARGYGESQPIAGNDTEAGREENRRIEFRLLSEHPVNSEPLPAPVTLAGVTREPAEAAPAPAEADGTEADGTEASRPDAGAMQGPVLPAPRIAAPAPAALPAAAASEATIAPATVGASEEFRTLDEREESIRLPVLAPDADTPRPAPRPDDAGPAPETTD